MDMSKRTSSFLAFILPRLRRDRARTAHQHAWLALPGPAPAGNEQNARESMSRFARADCVRQQALAELEARQRAYAAELDRWHTERLWRELARGDRGWHRDQALQHIATQRAKDQTERIRREAEERAAVLAAYPVPGRGGAMPDAAFADPSSPNAVHFEILMAAW
jgi:hypothetical protein